MPFLTANNIRLYYESTGQGEPLLLLHGLGSSAADWLLQVPAFSPHYRVITLDGRGHGQSDKPPGPYSIQLFAQDIAALLDRLTIPSAHVLGLSLGGCVAQQLALDYPDIVKSLVLVNTFSRLRMTTLQARLRGLIRFPLLWFFPMETTARYIARALFPKPEQKMLYDLAVQRMAQNDKRAYRDSIWAIMRFDSSAQLGRVRCPTLIVAGDRDTTVPLALKHELQALLPGSILRVIADSGHATPIDQPEEFNRVVLEFLRKL